jgi:protein SCO1/2
MSKLLLPLACLLACVLTLSACDHKGVPLPKTAFANTDVTGLDYGKDFLLTDHNGKTRTIADFRGKLVFVFFGYTHCPDICPTTLSDMAGIMTSLGPDADKLQVLFITLDPERDTPEVMAGYVPAFHPGFLGLYGDRLATEKVAREFKIFQQRVAGPDGKSYTIDHTAASYVFDTRGHLRLFVRHGQNGAPLLNDLKLLLSEN